MITFTYKGDFKNTTKFLKRMASADFPRILSGAAQKGVSALAAATPVDSGVSAGSWGYTTKRTRSSFEIVWTNSNTVDGTPLVVLLQYGHGTGTGGFVRGRDFINPAMRPIFDQIIADLWTEVTTA